MAAALALMIEGQVQELALTGQRRVRQGRVRLLSALEGHHRL
jgi:hypothetical protein